MRCLLIDDDAPTIEALLGIMRWEELGFTAIDTAFNIQDARQLFAAAEPDVIICDIEMPRGSGLEMIQWVREQESECGFIFFTCHESFEFASSAIAYRADSYLVKPLDKNKLTAALQKSVESLEQRRSMGKLAHTWLKNRDVVEKSFWSDVLSAAISPRKELLASEVEKRGLGILAESRFRLMLVSVPQSHVERSWDESLFHYALSNLCSELLLGQLNHKRLIAYRKDGVFYNIIVWDSSSDFSVLQRSAEHFISVCGQYLQCKATCYMGEETDMTGLSRSKAELEQLDNSNIIFRGKVQLQHVPFSYDTSERYALNFDDFAMLFLQKEKLRIVNRLKKELAYLAGQNRLDQLTLHSIREDFLQVVYSFLSRHHIQAHRLFADQVSQQLAHHADSSVIDFMKWAHAVTEKSIGYVDELLQSQSAVEKAKRFIHENFHLDLNRDDVAASVYLTADYLAKTFKLETGQSIKDYLNDCRIKAAKHLLVGSTESISAIALQTGFDNLSYFSTLFKKATGETPNAYRQKFKHA